jgi:hypothetical protein
MKVCKLEWFGHVVRKDGVRTGKKLPKGETEGMKRNGRSRMRWMDDDR